MYSAESTPGTPQAGVEVEALHQLMVTATQRLLGDTISVTDEEWRGASRLPGWSRGHVASHIARQADALVRLISGARSGEPQPMYASAEQRSSEIESGSGRTGLELQIDLDTSAGALTDAFEAVDQESAWDAVVELRGGERAPVRLLPLARLCEVVLHHIDLDVGFDLADVDAPIADWLLEWLAFRLRTRPDFPKVHVQSDSGTALLIGTEGDPVDVSGPSAQLLGWLTGRGSAEELTGADGIRLPVF